MRNFLKNFLKCGITGWCLEVLYTSLNSLRRRDMTLKGITSLWMFPIYGCAAIFTPLGRMLHAKPLVQRGLAYMSLLFSIEYIYVAHPAPCSQDTTSVPGTIPAAVGT